MRETHALTPNPSSSGRGGDKTNKCVFHPSPKRYSACWRGDGGEVLLPQGKGRESEGIRRDTARGVSTGCLSRSFHSLYIPPRGRLWIA